LIAVTRLLRASLLLGVVGLGIGVYLVWVHYDLDALVCGLGDCETVQTSTYAELAGIPIATLGAAMYAALLALTILRLVVPRWLTPASMAALAISGAGMLYSAWLTWIEIYEIEAICQWCVASAIVTTLLFLVEVIIFFTLWNADDPDDLTLMN
jgi:uncharacterized membrane protein